MKRKFNYDKVIPLLAEGMTRKQIANLLGIRYDYVTRFVRKYENQHKVIFPYDERPPTKLYKEAQ